MDILGLFNVVVEQIFIDWTFLIVCIAVIKFTFSLSYSLLKKI